MSTILITGCSRGFGQLTALHFARQGDTVFASMREPHTASDFRHLCQAEDLPIEILQLDVTDQASVDQAIAQASQQSGRIDVVVNNAGIHTLSAFEDLPEATLQYIMETNFFGPLRVTRAVLPLMRAQRSGVVVVVTGLSGFIGMPGETAYTASKFALEGAAESLQYEVERFGIRIAVVEPSFFHTASHRHPDCPAMPLGSPYQPLIQKLHEHHMMIADTGEDPQQVADAIYAAVYTKKPKLRYIPGKLGPAAAAYRREVTDEEYATALRSFLNIDWWTNRERESR